MCLPELNLLQVMKGSAKLSNNYYLSRSFGERRLSEASEMAKIQKGQRNWCGGCTAVTKKALPFDRAFFPVV